MAVVCAALMCGCASTREPGLGEKLTGDAATYRLADQLAGGSGVAGVAVLGTLIRVVRGSSSSGQYCHESKEGCKLSSTKPDPAKVVQEEPAW